MGRWRMRLAFLAVLCVPLLLMVGWNWYSREAIAWDYTGPATRVFYCGREYLSAVHVTHGAIDAERTDLGSFPIQQVGKTSSGKPILARPVPDSMRHPYAGPPLPCTFSVYVQTRADDFIAYSLSGGP
jgi:hypothetical protein